MRRDTWLVSPLESKDDQVELIETIILLSFNSKGGYKKAKFLFVNKLAGGLI